MALRSGDAGPPAVAAAPSQPQPQPSFLLPHGGDSGHPAAGAAAAAAAAAAATAAAHRRVTNQPRWQCCSGPSPLVQLSTALRGTWACLVLLGFLQCVLAWALGQTIHGLSAAHSWLLQELPPVVNVLAWGVWRLGMLWSAAALTSRFAGVAAGSGIADMKCVLSGFEMPESISAQTGVIKAAGLVLGCASGLPVGRVGPLVHIAGCLAHWLLQRRWFVRLRGSKETVHQVLGAACAVGVTSAFGSPIGGVLFSIEVTATYYLTSSYWRAFLTAVSGSVAFKLLGELLSRSLWHPPYRHTRRHG
jgi:chloride channel 2